MMLLLLLRRACLLLVANLILMDHSFQRRGTDTSHDQYASHVIDTSCDIVLPLASGGGLDPT